ncbi:hypothetical protein ABES80_12240 [Bacillus gobiensis]|uniref:hypothetical protein n=1 Tax=Bacillus gobiensis TaxID=1441095 RepID=UPI003D1BFB51
MKKETVSVVKVWEDKDRFNVHINELGIMLAVYKNRHPKSYTKIADWLNKEEQSFITPLFGQDSMSNVIAQIEELEEVEPALKEMAKSAIEENKNEVLEMILRKTYDDELFFLVEKALRTMNKGGNEL